MTNLHGGVLGSGAAVTWTAKESGTVRRLIARADSPHGTFTLTKNGTPILQSTGRRVIFLGRIPYVSGDTIVATFDGLSAADRGHVQLRV